MEEKYVTHQDFETARILRCLEYAKLLKKKIGMSAEMDQEDLVSNE